MKRPVLLQVDGLVQRFGALTAIDHAQLTVRRGDIHALIGPNGAGKTTLIHLISGTLAVGQGTIVFDNQEVTRLPLRQRVQHGLVRSFQITSVFKRLSVHDNVALAVQATGTMGFWQPARRDTERYQRAAAVLERVGLAAQRQCLAAALSHGEQRLLEVALALATEPKLLLLDEPMAGLGPQESERMVSLLHSLRGQTTLLLVEHDMNAVFRLADQISVLAYGKIIASGTPEVIRQNAGVRQAYLGDEVPLP